MIGAFPDLYPDELVYSCLSRYAAYTGYLVHRSVAEDLFLNRLDRPSVEFFNALTEDALSRLTAKRYITDMIHDHTMFDYYARFASAEKRKRLMDMLIAGDVKGFNNAISTRKVGERFLRFCTSCAQGDRERYGETYWHRIHQLPEIRVCAKHGCYLCDTEISMGSNTSPAFYPAEVTVPYDMAPRLCDNTLELQIAQYVSSVFESKYNMESIVSVGAFLRSRLEGTKYSSPRGEACHLALLYNDIQEHYKGIDTYGFTESWQLSKLLTGNRHNFYEVCLVALFLGIQPEELSEMTLPIEAPHERFDRLVHEMRAQGLKSPEIGRRLGASNEIVKKVWVGAYHHVSDASEPRQPTARGCAIDWNKLDQETLPRVRKIVSELQNIYSDTRPTRITKGAVSRFLGLREGQINNTPKCLKYIKSRSESLKIHHARCLIWAYLQLSANGEPITQTRLQQKLNCRKYNLIDALPHLEKFASPDVVEGIRAVISTS